MVVQRTSCSNWLWSQSEELWEQIRTHPFLRELEAGTLPDSKLKFYFEQNIQYVDTVYRTKLIAAARAPDAKTFELLAGQWSPEPSQDRQARLLRAFGGDPDNLPEMAPACRGYTYHMWHNVLAGGSLQWLTSFLACPWTYDVIGHSIAGRLKEERRADWMEWYGSDGHHELLAGLQDVVDRLTADVDEKGRELLLRNWRLGMRYEWMFWDDAYHERAWPI
jgi:thiaminase/transcriptional activator TenA